MKWKLLCLCGLLLFTCSCAGLYAAKTEVEIYDNSGNTIAKIFNNKSYQGLQWHVEKRPDGTTIIKYSAKVTDANTIAAAAVESQGNVIKALTGLVGTVK